MDQKVVLRFRNSSKAGTVAEFPVKQYRSISVGRDPSCEVAYDSDRDDLVSRLHLKITIEGGNPLVCEISDFGSRNGTFVNHQRLATVAKIMPGDIVQLGAGGPEFEFDVEPRPVGAKATRLATEALAAPPTREAGPISPSKATVEHMIASSQQKSSNAAIWVGLGILGLLIMIGGAFAIPAVRAKVFGAPKLSAAAISKQSNEAVVFFEMSWKLYDLESGVPLFHAHVLNTIPPKEGEEKKEIVPGGPPKLPIFVPVAGSLEPLLVTESGDGRNVAVSSGGSGSGFVVSPDGFILTNRHVAAGWMSPYNFRANVGVIVEKDAEGNTKFTPIGAQNFPHWTPSRARFVHRGSFDMNSPIVGQPASGKIIEGRNDFLEITFPGNRNRTTAKLVRISDEADVALVKVDMPQALHKLSLNDNYDTIVQGDEISVLGYPGVSPMVVGGVQSKDSLTASSEMRVIPDPTLSLGNIGRIIRSKAGLTEGTLSMMGDVYQLTVNSTGAGNSGGPVLDEKGQVVGLFTYSREGDFRLTFAVPIRYGMQLMGIKPAN